MSEQPENHSDPESNPRFAGKDLAKELTPSETHGRGLGNVAKDIRGILADMSSSDKHPSTFEKPDKEAGKARQIMHLVHRALYRTGRLAEKNYSRKVPNWPLPPHSPDGISVIAYGSEKVSYKVHLDDGEDVKLSVYHLEALRQNPHEVAMRKKKRHETYEKYYGDIVLPTAFLEVDNPWGEGKKPAMVQRYLPDIQEFSSLTREQIMEKAKVDPEFAASLNSLTSGYKRMIQDNMCPDFASANILISGSRIVLPDTGNLYKVGRLPHLKEIHKDYELIESFL